MVVTDKCLERFPTLSTGIRLTGKRNPLLPGCDYNTLAYSYGLTSHSCYCSGRFEMERELGTMMNAFLGVDEDGFFLVEVEDTDFEDWRIPKVVVESTSSVKRGDHEDCV
ncbi:unnamed protein product [Brassica oleracea]